MEATSIVSLHNHAHVQVHVNEEGQDLKGCCIPTHLIVNDPSFMSPKMDLQFCTPTLRQNSLFPKA